MNKLLRPTILLTAAALAFPLGSDAQQGRVVILQTNAAGDQVHVIDAATNRVSEIIEGIPIPHGVTSHPSGTVVYVSNEHDRALDFVSTGRPHRYCPRFTDSQLHVPATPV